MMNEENKNTDINDFFEDYEKHIYKLKEEFKWEELKENEDKINKGKKGQEEKKSL
jgi:hypothetical protein